MDYTPRGINFLVFTNTGEISPVQHDIIYSASSILYGNSYIYIDSIRVEKMDLTGLHSITGYMREMEKQGSHLIGWDIAVYFVDGRVLSNDLLSIVTGAPYVKGAVDSLWRRLIVLNKGVTADTLVHEIAHCFGANHDDELWTYLNLNRNRSFGW